MTRFTCRLVDEWRMVTQLLERRDAHQMLSTVSPRPSESTENIKCVIGRHDLFHPFCSEGWNCPALLQQTYGWSYSPHAPPPHSRAVNRSLENTIYLIHRLITLEFSNCLYNFTWRSLGRQNNTSSTTIQRILNKRRSDCTMYSAPLVIYYFTF